jgi:fluoroacetyl-CoA thioesterase
MPKAKPKEKTQSKAASKSPAKKKQKAATDAPSSSLPRIGLEADYEALVKPENTIHALNPNLPAVLSTPSMIGMMEHATVVAIMHELPEGTISVGTRIEVDHLKAVGPGAKVISHAKLVKYEGRFLVFEVEARSGEHVIGRGRVFRAIVHPQAHGEKAKARVQS